MDVATLLNFGAEAVVRAAIATLPLFLIVLTVTSFARQWLLPWTRQALWSLVLVRLLLPVSIGSPLSFQPAALLAFKQAVTNTELALVASNDLLPSTIERDETDALQPTPSYVTAAASNHIDASNLIHTTLLIMFWVGACGMAIWTGIVSWRLRRTITTAREFSRDNWSTLLEEGQRRFGIRQSIALQIVPGLASPATYGWWHPLILLPEDAETWSSTEVRHVLWHELAHISRHDVAANGLLAIARIVQWWNPMFWWSQRKWLEEREISCDALVLHKFDPATAAEYGHTLVRFFERVSNSSLALPQTVPSFALLSGNKRGAKRRLAELARSAQPASTIKRWLMGACVLVFAVCGLTDAASPERPAVPTGPVELPAGTAWKLISHCTDDEAAERSTQFYDLTATIKRAQQDEPALSVEIAGQHLQQTFQGILAPTVSSHADVQQGIQQAKPRSTAALQAQNLVVYATPAQHAEVRRLLENWSRHGLRQISVGLQIVSTSLPIKELVSGSGGIVVNESRSEESPRYNSDSVPTFTRLIDDAEVTVLMQKLNADPRSNTIMAPKVTVFNGLAASILCGTEHPFVTGLQTGDADNLQPQISIVHEGLQIQFQPQIVDDSATRLNLHIEKSHIANVEVLETTIDGQSYSVQIPQISKVVVDSNTAIPAEQSLLMIPLRRDHAGQLQIYLVKPLQLDLR